MLWVSKKRRHRRLLSYRALFHSIDPSLPADKLALSQDSSFLNFFPIHLVFFSPRLKSRRILQEKEFDWSRWIREGIWPTSFLSTSLLTYRYLINFFQTSYLLHLLSPTRFPSSPYTLA